MIHMILLQSHHIYYCQNISKTQSVYNILNKYFPVEFKILIEIRSLTLTSKLQLTVTGGLLVHLDLWFVP